VAGFEVTADSWGEGGQLNWDSSIFPKSLNHIIKVVQSLSVIPISKPN